MLGCDFFIPAFALQVRTSRILKEWKAMLVSMEFEFGA